MLNQELVAFEKKRYKYKIVLWASLNWLHIHIILCWYANAFFKNTVRYISSVGILDSIHFGYSVDSFTIEFSAPLYADPYFLTFG